ncbi:hypothetical protein [Vallitalea guaymasensis]|uniref:hypothetical protein n=1 Tax=Vallitalea guaymasensis TaxID=1185412 RepID=UPI000DE41130|nr:hypothetical protein [Vallitalea guaymasensis]
MEDILKKIEFILYVEGIPFCTDYQKSFVIDKQYLKVSNLTIKDIINLLPRYISDHVIDLDDNTFNYFL